MEQRRLGTNGPLVDVLALGTWAIGGTQWGPSDDEESLAALRAGLDAGMTFIDTADTYGEGRSEEIAGRAIQGRRDGLFISSKVGVLGNPTVGWKIDLTRKHILEGCDDSLRRLGIDAIDLYQLHWSSKDVPLEESVGALNTLREQGKIRYAAVCNFSAEELPDITASYQEAIVDTLVEKTIKAAGNNGINRIVVCGGVAANSRLREKFAAETALRKIDLFIPPVILCTDNAAMIAAIGEIMLKNGRRDSLDLNAVSRWPLA